MDIIISKTEKNPSLIFSNNNANNTSTEGSNSIVINFYHPITREKLDSSICNNIKISSPLNLDTNDILEYKELKNKTGIDRLNPKDRAFNDRCYSVQDPYTGVDTTVNYRIEKYFFNKSISCSVGCEYSRLEDNSYGTCQCTNAGSDIFNELSDFVMQKLSDTNIDIITCFGTAFSVKLYLT
jgi:hypothetical protein